MLVELDWPLLLVELDWPLVEFMGAVVLWYMYAHFELVPSVT